MTAVTVAQGATWAISAIAASGVIGRPRRLPEAVWAVLGAAALVALALMPWPDALRAVGRGTDVHLFLTGMMLLAELARNEGVFDWLAALCAQQARGSARRLFALVFVVGTVMTVLLSNDATAVVLTPAVYAVARAAAAEPLPYLFVCSFIANAASFVLPISNPGNLVVFDGRLPPLSSWLAQFAVPSSLAVGATYTVLRLSQRKALRQPIARKIAAPVLSSAGWVTVSGIGFAVAVLLGASALGFRLGPPTALAGALTVLVLLSRRQAPWAWLKNISWSVLPLVAGLFVLVEGLARTGVTRELSETPGSGRARPGTHRLGRRCDHRRRQQPDEQPAGRADRRIGRRGCGAVAAGHRRRARGEEPIAATADGARWWTILECRPLVVYAACTMLFHFANAPLLPLVGQKLALGNMEFATAMMSACIIAAQLVMLPIALFAGRKADSWGRKPILSIGFAILPVRAFLYTLSNDSAWVIAVQLLDGVGAGIFGVLMPLVVADLMRGRAATIWRSGLLPRRRASAPRSAAWPPA